MVQIWESERHPEGSATHTEGRTQKGVVGNFPIPLCILDYSGPVQGRDLRHEETRNPSTW